MHKEKPSTAKKGPALEQETQEEPDERSKAFNSTKGRPPKISLHNYVDRIWHYGLDMRDDLLLVFPAALVLLRQVACVIKITPLNMHRIVALCLLAVTKHSTNSYGGDDLWAAVLGMDERELKKLEESFYDVLDCQLEVPQDRIDAAMEDIKNADMLKDGFG